MRGKVRVAVAQLLPRLQWRRYLMRAGIERREQANPAPVVTLADVADHIEHVHKVAGIDHVGIGADFDGMDEFRVKGLEDVSTFPALFEELARRGWTDTDLRKLAGENFLRVLRRVEAAAKR